LRRDVREVDARDVGTRLDCVRHDSATKVTDDLVEIVVVGVLDVGLHHADRVDAAREEEGDPLSVGGGFEGRVRLDGFGGGARRTRVGGGDEEGNAIFDGERVGVSGDECRVGLERLLDRALVLLPGRVLRVRCALNVVILGDISVAWMEGVREGDVRIRRQTFLVQCPIDREG
jgi:hypothetical protein